MKDDALDCNDDIDVECAIPLIKENDNWVVHAQRVRTLADSGRVVEERRHHSIRCDIAYDVHRLLHDLPAMPARRACD